MNSAWGRASVFAVTVIAFANGNALACSLDPDSKAQETNFELARDADVIFVGSLVRSVGKGFLDNKLLVKPTYLVKGTTLPKEVYIRGFLSDETIKLPNGEVRVSATKSSELDLWRPNPEVWTGVCSRQIFDRKMQLVLFFKQDGEKLNWLDPAFSRSSEDVASLDSLWVRAVKLYAQISQLPESEQKSALNAELLLLRKNGFLNRKNVLLADDIERQLAGVGPVSEFDIQSGTAEEKRWIENIVNDSYHGEVAVAEDVVVSKKPPRTWTSWWVLGGLGVALLIVALVTILRNRARKSA